MEDILSPQKARKLNNIEELDLIRRCKSEDPKINKEAKTELFIQYHDYIMSIITKCAPQFNDKKNIDHKKECLVDAYLAICDNLDNYDPRKSKLSSYIYYVVKHSVCVYRNESFYNEKTYYRKIKEKIKKATDILKDYGIINPTDVQIAIMIDRNTETIAKMRNNVNKFESLEASRDDTDDNSVSREIADTSINIEKNIIDSNAAKLIYTAINQLKDNIEREILLNVIAPKDEQYSGNDLARKLQISPTTLKQKHASALNHLCNNPLFHENYGDRIERLKGKPKKEFGMVHLNAGRKMLEDINNVDDNDEEEVPIEELLQETERKDDN